LLVLHYNDMHLFTHWARWFRSLHINPSVAFCTQSENHLRFIPVGYFWVQPES